MGLENTSSFRCLIIDNFVRSFFKKIKKYFVLLHSFMIAVAILSLEVFDCFSLLSFVYVVLAAKTTSSPLGVGYRLLEETRISEAEARTSTTTVNNNNVMDGHSTKSQSPSLPRSSSYPLCSS